MPTFARTAGAPPDRLLLDANLVVGLDDFDRRVRGVGEMHAGRPAAGAVMPRALAAAMDLVQHLPRAILPRLRKKQYAGGGGASRR